MWWRALGVAVVLLCVGVAGGYAVADRTTEEPARSDTLEPVPAVSPAMPTPPERAYRPDSDTAALEPGLPLTPVDLRVTSRGVGVTVGAPEGWEMNRVLEANMWNFAAPSNPSNTYSLRITYVRNQNASIAAVKAGRIAALEDAEANGGIEDFEVTSNVGDTFEASYVDGGYYRLTMEQWVSFDGSHAYAGAAVTGRSVDREGLRDLLTRAVDSMVALPPKPPKKKGADTS